MNFCFFHIGTDTRLPMMLCASIKKTNPSSQIIQLTDSISPKIDGVDVCLRFNGNRGTIMKFRTECYAELPVEVFPCVLLDTDMLVCKSIDGAQIFQKHRITLCERYFDRTKLVNINFQNLSMHEYSGKTLYSAWPFLGCFIGATQRQDLREINQYFDELEDKYKNWYGDQIALKIFYEKNRDITHFVSESIYACLPDARNKSAELLEKAAIIHFKGSAKDLMPIFFDEKGFGTK